MHFIKSKSTNAPNTHPLSFATIFLWIHAWTHISHFNMSWWFKTRICKYCFQESREELNKKRNWNWPTRWQSNKLFHEFRRKTLSFCASLCEFVPVIFVFNRSEHMFKYSTAIQTLKSYELRIGRAREILYVFCIG